MVAAITGVVRHVLTFGGGYLVQDGLLSTPDLETGIGAVVTLIGLAWSIYDKKKNA
jgi:hypothetical protein